jgi:hypothetical protein
MNYLVIDEAGHRIVPAEKLRKEIDSGKGDVRIFRLCGMNDPKELFVHWIRNYFVIVDKYGYAEEGV